MLCLAYRCRVLVERLHGVVLISVEWGGVACGAAFLPHTLMKNCGQDSSRMGQSLDLVEGSRQLLLGTGAETVCLSGRLGLFVCRGYIGLAVSYLTRSRVCQWGRRNLQ